MTFLFNGMKRSRGLHHKDNKEVLHILKAAQIQFYTEIEKPIYTDDIFSELDHTRRKQCLFFQVASDFIFFS